MSTQKEGETSSQSSEVSKFYAGKSLFITGASGFLGLVIVEILLRCCSDIRRIYILLRPKNGVQPEERKDLLFKKDIFCKVREKNPEALNKVVVVAGDTAYENLGMCEDDIKRVTEEVSVVFHCAAVISFFKSLSFIMQQNVLGTHNVIEFCRKLKKLEVLVYTSTAYSNSNRFYIEEKVYDLPFRAEKAVELSKNGHEKELMGLFEKCNPKLPNYYTFSKCVAENLISERASDFPICIVRPSVIICTMSGALPGYVEYGSGIVSISVGIGKGFIRVFRVDSEKLTDMVPADIVANTHILAAYYQVLDRLPSPTIYNCTSADFIPYTWGDFIQVLFNMAKKNPLPKSYQKPGLIVCKSAIAYWCFSVIDHYIPAFVIDTLLWISGRKPRLVKLYRFYDRSLKAIHYFTFNEWKFQCENFKSLSEKLSPADSEMFLTNPKDVTLEKISKNLLKGSPMYREKDDKPEKERMRIAYMRYYFTSLIKWSVIGGVVSFLYYII